MRVLVTGANSPLGEAVCKAAKSQKLTVVGAIRGFKPYWRNEYVDDLIEIDLLQPRSVRALTPGIDSVIHVAAQSYGSPHEIMAATGLGTFYLASRAAEVGVKRFVHVSGISVYGRVVEGVINASTSIRHSSSYGAAKWAAECYLRQLQGAMSSISVRSPAIVGKRFANHFLGRLVGEMKDNAESIEVSNPKFRFNNVVHESILAKFLVSQSLTVSEEFCAVPLASSFGLLIESIVARLRCALNYKGAIKWTDSTERPFSIDLTSALELGFEPATTSETLDRWVDELTLEVPRTVNL